MSTISSTELHNGDPIPRRRVFRSYDWSLALGKLGTWLAIVAFGGVLWAINGGFSVLGLDVLASAFNSAGKLFWAMVSAWTFRVPVVVPGLPVDQPLIPWIGVIAASLLQIAVGYRKLRGLRVPGWMLIAATVLSIYDFATTFFGLTTVAWIAKAGLFVQIPLAILMTFVVEVTVTLVLRGGRYGRESRG